MTFLSKSVVPPDDRDLMDIIVLIDASGDRQMIFQPVEIFPDIPLLNLLAAAVVGRAIEQNQI
jgi:hypothetical protein